MFRTVLIALAIGSLASVPGVQSAAAAGRDRYEVHGVEGDDMLKMRSGPGTGYNIIVGLPNGTVVRVRSCQQTGSTRWCKVALDRAPGLKGYVSWAYLREM
ncbi:SH3 domain-containing protein [Pukyongiella litopenaei]|uniref:SH3 domain-containing protein n=1 Tax=Pukyongiella litopenaei TaxID=2605946 RepID=A0A2S0MN38_9RHOB|nr:SH3 domain-containing protein [Pukyongiella litopenaei]AVO37284.1 SH3 domain-containing protein [Pukyongiella litopenaei]